MSTNTSPVPSSVFRLARRSPRSPGMMSRPTRTHLAALVIGSLGMLFALLFLIHLLYRGPAANEISDQSQLANTVFTCLAFAMLLFTTWLQVYGLHVQNQELQLARDEAQSRRHADAVAAIASASVELMAEPAMAELSLKLDYNRFQFDLSTDLDTTAELNLVRFLDRLNVIGFHFHHKLVEAREIASTTVGHMLLTAWKNRVVQSYLTHVDAFDQAVQEPGMRAFAFFRELGSALETTAANKPAA